MITICCESVFHDGEDWENDSEREYTVDGALEELSYLLPEPGEQKPVSLSYSESVLTRLDADEISFQHYDGKYSNTYIITGYSEEEMAPIVDFVNARIASFDSVEVAV